MKLKDNKVFWLIIFFVSSSFAILINKYILWKLNFTYPSIFQSWQMSVASLFLISANSFEIIKIMPLSTESFKRLLPSTFLFTVSIYSGSKALSMLPVPIFCLIQQMFIQATIYIVEIYKTKKSMSNYQAVCIMTPLFIIWITYLFDNEYENQVKYVWILINCLCICLNSIYISFFKSINVQEIDKIFLNTKSSIIFLSLFGILTGETPKVINFQKLYHTFFHLLFVGSGVFGALMMLSYGRLCNLFSLSRVRFFNAISMFIVSIASIIVYDTKTSVYKLWFAVLGLASVSYYSYSVSKFNYQLGLKNQEV
ncbi:UDP-N-acetylglucosamine transporter TMEM241 [Hydra vulgaris]|nr:transmembrane protein 241 [Hydra vulgaris]